MFAGNNVIAISSLGGAPGIFWLRILKGLPRLYIHVQLTLFVYLERFRRYSTFFIWLDFPTGGECLGVLGQNDPQNVKWEKTLAGRALPYAKLRLLSHCAWNYLYPFGLCRCAREKGRRAGRNKSQEVYISHMRGATSRGLILTKQDKCVCLTDIIKRAKFYRYNLRGFGSVRCWSIHVATGNPDIPNTLCDDYRYSLLL